MSLNNNAALIRWQTERRHAEALVPDRRSCRAIRLSQPLIFNSVPHGMIYYPAYFLIELPMYGDQGLKLVHPNLSCKASIEAELTRYQRPSMLNASKLWRIYHPTKLK